MEQVHTPGNADMGSEYCACGGETVYYEDGDRNGKRGYGCEVTNLIYATQPRRRRTRPLTVTPYD